MHSQQEKYMTPCDTQTHCPCGSKKTYSLCCGKFINGALPATPEELMRSRYTAYAIGNFEYIMRTMKSPAADHFQIEEAHTTAKQHKWVGLTVIQTAQESSDGMVEFKAYYLHANNLYVLHEISQFRRDDDAWYYIDSKTPATQHLVKKMSRNDLCICGSEKKFKKCCNRP